MTVSRAILLALLTCFTSGIVLATDARESAGGEKPVAADKHRADQSLPTPTNLKVLPKDASTKTLRKVMRGFERDLGVQCNHCHVENRETEELDYASEENPRKQTARLMMTMLNDINDKYLAQIGGDRRYAVPITCGNCHQGQTSPPEYEAEWW
jgi:hypothetical protein